MPGRVPMALGFRLRNARRRGSPYGVDAHVDARAHVEVAAVRAHEVERHDRARHQLVRPAERRLPRVRHLEPRIGPLTEERERPDHRLVLALDVRGRLADAVEAAVRIADALLVVHRQHRAKAATGRVTGRKQRVRVGVAHVHVDAPAAAKHAAAVARDVVGEADARLEVVLVFLRLEPGVLEALDARQQPGARQPPAP